MNSETLYDKKIKYFEQEIRNLKDAHIKTSTTIKTKTLETSVEFSLYLPTYPLTTEILSTQRAIITLTASDSTNMISACYLKNVTPNNLNDRYIFVNRLSSDNGEAKYGISVFSQNVDDLNTLIGGGSVNLTYNIQVVGSSDYSLSVEYKNILGGT